MAKFKVGDKVYVKPDLNSSRDYKHDNGNSDNASDEMVKLAGQTVTISAVFDHGYHIAELNAWNWVDDMFQFVVNTEPATTAPVKLPKTMTAHTILGQDKIKKHLKVAIEANMPVLLVGDTGTGKTTIVKDLADKVQKTWVRFNLTGETTVEEFVGKYTLSNGETQWQDGVLLSAMKQGHWLIVDEVNVALPEILFVLHSLLDDERAVMVANHDGEVVKPHEQFRFFATMNPVDEYAGTKDLNKAFKSRFGMILNMDYPTPRFETAILESKGQVDGQLAAKLVDIAVTLRKAKKAGQIFYTCSTRDLLQVAALAKPLGIAEAIKVAIVSKANGDGRAVIDLIKRIDQAYAQVEAVTGENLNIEILESKMAEFQVKSQELEARAKDLDRKDLNLARIEKQQTEQLAIKKKQLVKEALAEAKKQLISELTTSKAVR